MASLTQWKWVEKAQGVGDGYGSLACCSPLGHKETDTTEQVNWLTEVILLTYTIDKLEQFFSEMS